MKKTGKQLLFGILFLFLALVTTSCGDASEKGADAKAELQAVYSRNYEALRSKVHETALEMLEAYQKKRGFGDRDSSFYALQKAKLYADESLNEETAVDAIYKSELIVDLPEGIDRKDLKDANSEGDDMVYRVISMDGEKTDKYVKSSHVFKDRFDFIYYPEEGVSYEPFPKKEYASNPPIKVRGVYVTASSAMNGAGNLDYLIELARTTDINTFVIDVKDDNGRLLFTSKAAEKYMPQMNETAAIKDIEAFIKRLKDENIYLIARIVTFKSPEYAKAYPEKAIVYKSSREVYMSGDGLKWASPYDRDLWEYNIMIAEEAAELGFNEIQFDYVRFPDVTAATNENLDFQNHKNESKTVAIHGFLEEAYKRLSAKEVYVTADFFGYVATALNDQFIGQHWESVCNVVDYSAPMVYPSHYGPGNFGLAVPDARPYECIDGAMKDAIDRNKNLYTPAKLRPWIQDFTAPWIPGYIPYGKAEVMAQIQALKDNGIDEYMLWNAGNKYTAEALHNDERE
ncbi:MAG: putative glycoside hydrolase [Bacillota bacterium]|nr:putative glycoside hydrolase [Bacillota bacterium]